MFSKVLKGLFFILVVAQMSFVSQSTSTKRDESIKLVRRTAYLIVQNYYDDKRIKPVEMLKAGFYQLAKKVPEVLPEFKGKTLHFKLGADTLSLPLQKMDHIYDVLPVVSQVFDFLKNTYKGETTLDEMEYAFLSGFVEELDPHSRFFPPQDNKEFKTQTSGNYGGLGIVVGYEDYKLTVISPVQGTPADRANIKSGERILQIDDYSTVNINLQDAVDLMRGKAGTKVVLKLKAKDGSVRNVKLIRERIKIQSAEAKVVPFDGKNLGVVKIKSFQGNTLDEFREELSQIQEKDLKGLVIDLRRNIGGLFDTAIQITDRFLRNGTVVSTVYGNQYEDYFARNQFSDVDLPIIVLIDEGSASAAEIVAGALKNNDRAVVIGRTSFGKGSVQNVFNLKGGSSLKMTVAEYLTPGRQSIQAVGVVPDIYVYPSMVSKKGYDLKENVYYTEQKLDAHYESKNVRKEKQPDFKLTYIKENVEEAERTNRFIIKIQEEDDYELHLALKLLSEAPSADKSEMLKEFKTLLKKEAANQDKALVKSLAQQQIVWQSGQKEKQPEFQMSYSFLDENQKPIQILQAGHKYELVVNLKNLSLKPVHRVLASFDSLNALLNNREFVFGKILPGEKKSQSITITVPHEINNFEEKSKLAVYTELTLEKPNMFSVNTKFKEKPSPVLSYYYKIYDGNGLGSKGNQNGVPEVGEKIAFEAKVKNLGPTTSEETMVSFYNRSKNSIFLYEARKSLDKILVGEEKKVHFLFDVQSAPQEQSFYEFDFYAVDNLTQAQIFDSIKLHAQDVKKFKPSQVEYQKSPQIVLSDQSSRTKNKYNLIGKVFHDLNLKDIAIYVGGKKVYYQNLEKITNIKARDFEVSLPLEEGLNSIIIQARGSRDLATIKTLSIVYDPKEKIAEIHK